MPVPITPTVYICVNGGDTIGLGHISRQCWVGQALQQAGAHVKFITETPEAIYWIKTHINPLAIVVPGKMDVYLREVAQHNLSVILFDLPAVDQALCRELRQHCPVVQCDTLDPTCAADLVVIPSLHVSPARLAGYPMPVLAGPQHLLLPPRYATRKRYPYNERKSTLLITAGGGEVVTLLEHVARVARDQPWAHHTTLMSVLPPHHSAARVLGAHLPLKWLPWEPAWLASARLAIIPLGQTVYETLFAWTPMLVWARTDTDQAHLPTLHQYGIRTAHVPNPWTADPQRFAAQIQDAWDNVAWQQQAIATAQALSLPLDGAQRIARACLQLLSARG